MFEFKDFPFPRLIAFPKLDISVCFTVYSSLIGEIDGVVFFSGVLVQSEIQTDFSSIWINIYDGIFRHKFFPTIIIFHKCFSSMSKPQSSWNMNNMRKQWVFFFSFFFFGVCSKISWNLSMKFLRNRAVDFYSFQVMSMIFFFSNCWECIVFIEYHHHHVVPLARISLTLSCHFSLSSIASGRSSGLHPVSSHSCWMCVCAGRPAFARPYVGSIGVHRLWVHPCFSSSVLHVWFI